MPRPLRVALGRRDHEPQTMVPVDAEICLPFPLLHGGELRLWRSPRKLVGGEALKKVLEAEKDAARRRSGLRGGNGGVGGGGGGGAGTGEGEWEGAVETVDIGEEVTVPISPTTFDRRAKVVDRHSHRCVILFCEGRVLWWVWCDVPRCACLLCSCVYSMIVSLLVTVCMFGGCYCV